jgi:hypothetical protein
VAGFGQLSPVPPLMDRNFPSSNLSLVPPLDEVIKMVQYVLFLVMLRLRPEAGSRPSRADGSLTQTMSEPQILSLVPDDTTFDSYKIITDLLPLSRRALSNVHGLLKIALVL